jgi:dipeptidyl aminopeptidase/acylaminoacyl peptidase
MAYRPIAFNRIVASFILLSLISFPFATAQAQQKPNGAQATPAKFNLTIDNIMRGPELVGYEANSVRWSADSQKIYFQWKQYNDSLDKNFDTYVVNRDGSGLRKLTEEEAKNAPPMFGDQSKDKKFTVVTDSGDVVLYDNATGQKKFITRTTEVESNPRLTSDQRRVSFTRSNNLYVMSLDGGSIEQLTDIRSGAAPQQGGPQPPRKGTDSQEFIKKEERDLLDIVKRRAQRREEDEERRKREEKRKPFFIQGRQAVGAMQLTPNGKYVIATITERAEESKNTIVPNYVTESAYTEDINARTKVGDIQGRARILILNTETGESKWLDHGLKQAVANPDSGEGEQQGQAARANEPRDRDVQLSQPLWSEDGTKAILSVRSADNKDRWIMALDPESGKTRAIFTEHDDAWIGGPGAFTLGWLGDNQRIYFQSERDGYSHLYTVSYDGGQPKQLTSGKWEVTGVRLSEDKSRFFLTTSEVHPGERHLYSMSVEGGERVKITSMAGNNQTTISPDEKMIANLYSYSNKPTELYLMENRVGASATKVTTSPSPEFSTYEWIDPPIINFTARDGISVPARMYKPKNFKRGGPAVIFVHGAGYLQNVHRWWSNYFREYMFHHLLMEHGYMVLDVDYRASAGYGRDWRTGIYRFMGGKDLDDQIDAAKWMVSEHGVDAKRIGIYGGSYGGFITLMALFTQPDVFAAGAALRPVTDWAHYNHPYTSNILNLPQSDVEAYRKSSPIYHAQGLKGALLICHGMVDVNVHFQDTVRLVQKLIELRKENWEAAMYPVEDHGFVEPSSWADEYKRIFKLFQQNLQPDSRTASGKQADTQKKK